jgi:hypothetical protein
MVGGYTNTQQYGLISLILFLQNKESRLKMEKEVLAPLIQNCQSVDNSVIATTHEF